MKKIATNKETSAKKESAADLKGQSTNDKAVKKGYNENNPTQPQGAFKPDASTPKK